MTFTDQDRQALIELVNNIGYAYSAGQASSGRDSNRVALPCRLLRSAADVMERLYGPEAVSRLDASEVELLVTYLSNAVEAVAVAAGKVVTALPEAPPAEMLAKLDQRRASLEAVKEKRESLFSTARSLLEREGELLSEKRELEDLQRRQETLLAAQEQLKRVSLDDLREKVSLLDAELGPAQAELEQLQQSVTGREQALAATERALADARQSLSEAEAASEDQLTTLTRLGDDLVAALTPYIERCRRGTEGAVQAIAERTAEGKRLKHELNSRIVEVSTVYEETAELAEMLKLYAESNSYVARSVPAVVSATKERLSRIEEQLREIDGDLKRALEQHQSAKHVAAVVSF